MRAAIFAGPPTNDLTDRPKPALSAHLPHHRPTGMSAGQRGLSFGPSLTVAVFGCWSPTGTRS
jgi:hypothetical protein